MSEITQAEKAELAFKDPPDLKDKVKAAAEGKPLPKVQRSIKDPALQVNQALQKLMPQIQRALPKHLTAERMARITLTCLRENPKLMSSNMPSLLGAVMKAAQLGLEPGVSGQCHLVPFKGNVQLIIGYEGYMDLAYRSGMVTTINAEVVCENDEFAYEYGKNETLKHVPNEGSRGSFKGAYAYAHLKNGGFVFKYLPFNEIEKHRKFSASKNGVTWTENFEAMARKTAIRVLSKYLPKSPEIRNLDALDEKVVVDPFHVEMPKGDNLPGD